MMHGFTLAAIWFGVFLAGLFSTFFLGVEVIGVTILEDSWLYVPMVILMILDSVITLAAFTLSLAYIATELDF